MTFQTSLDRYLTSAPDDGFDNWCEAVIESISNQFYDENEDWITNSDTTCNKWLNKIFDKKGHLSIAESAKLIERAHKIFINSQK